MNITTADLVSLSELEKNNAHIYPNPTSGLIQIETNKEINSAVLMDLRGKEIQKINYTGALDATNQPEGMYLVRIEFADGQTETQKIIKK